MIRHILLIKFKSCATHNQIETLRKEFYSLVDLIEGVESVEWGMNNSPEGKNKDYSHSVLMTFTNEFARQAYLPHPAHSRLKNNFSPLLDDIIVFDYQV